MYNNFNNPLGFDKLEPKPDANQDMADAVMQEAYDRCVMIKKVFNTKEGKKLIEFLKKETLEASTWVPSANHEWSVATGFAREGQNALVRMLVSSIEAANTAKDPKECHELLNKMGVL